MTAASGTRTNEFQVLADAVKARMAYHGWKQKEVADRAGIVREVLASIERADPKRNRDTATWRGLERGVFWPAMTVDHILAGGPPPPVEQLTPHEATQPAVPGSDAEILDLLGEQVALLRTEIADLRDRVAQIEQRPRRAPRGR